MYKADEFTGQLTEEARFVQKWMRDIAGTAKSEVVTASYIWEAESTLVHVGALCAQGFNALVDEDSIEIDRLEGVAAAWQAARLGGCQDEPPTLCPNCMQRSADLLQQMASSGDCGSFYKKGEAVSFVFHGGAEEVALAERRAARQARRRRHSLSN